MNLCENLLKVFSFGSQRYNSLIQLVWFKQYFCYRRQLLVKSVITQLFNEGFMGLK